MGVVFSSSGRAVESVKRVDIRREKEVSFIVEGMIGVCLCVGLVRDEVDERRLAECWGTTSD